MNGIKTIITMLVAAYVVPFAVSHGLTVSPTDQAQMVGYGLAAAAIVMRFLSNGPALGDIRAWLTNRAKPTPIDIPTLADAVLAELLRRKAAKLKEQTK